MSGCLALTLLLVGTNFFLRSAHASAVQRHAEVREEGEQLLRTLGNRPHIEADLAALRAANAQIAANLMDEQSMEVNLGYFYRLEKANRVRLVRLNQLAAQVPLPGSLYKTLQFSMQVKGSYRNNVNFLRALETGPRILRLRNSSVERSSPDNGELMMDLTVEMLAKP